MKRGEKIGIIGFVIILLVNVFMVGCGKKENEQSQDVIENSKEEQDDIDKDNEDEEESQELTEEEKMQEEIKEVAEEFIKLRFASDPDGYQGDEWFHLYSKKLLEKAEEDGEKEHMHNFVTESKIVRTYDGTQNINVFTEDKEVIYTGVIYTTLVDATEEYLELWFMEKGQKEKQNIQLTFIEEDGDWKVDEILTWSVNEEEEQEKAEIQKVAEEFSTIIATADPETYQGDECFHLYSKERLQFAEEVEEQKDSKEFIMENNFHLSYEGLETLEISIDEETAVFKGICSMKTLDATDEYFKNNNIKAGDIEKYKVEYDLIKEDGQWKIHDIQTELIEN